MEFTFTLLAQNIQKYSIIQYFKSEFIFIQFLPRIRMKGSIAYFIKSCCIFAILVLCFFWTVNLSLKKFQSDYRVELLGLKKQLSYMHHTKEMHLEKIIGPFKMDNFELIKISNNSHPNLFSQYGLLIISVTNSLIQGSYANILQKLQKLNVGATQKIDFSYFVIRRRKPTPFNTLSQINLYTQQLSSMIEHLAQYVMIRKLTILAFQEGSLLVFRSLSSIQKGVFDMIDKIVLINLLSPYLVVYHSNARNFIQETKQLIIRDQDRIKLVNNTRIIIINTINTNLGYDQRSLNIIFNMYSPNSGVSKQVIKSLPSQFKVKKVTFANCVVISSRFIWNVYSYLKPNEYFRFQPFIWILSSFFHDDRFLEPRSIRQIEQFFLFRNPVLKIEMNARTKNGLQQCNIFYLQQYDLGGTIFPPTHHCIKVLRKSDAYFNQNTTIILSSTTGKFQVYDENLQRIIPMETKNGQYIFLFQTAIRYRKIIILNKYKRQIKMQVQGIYSFVENSLAQKFQHKQTMVHYIDRRNKNNLTPVLVCPGFTLLSPIHFAHNYQLPHPSSQYNIENLLNYCIKGEDYLYTLIVSLAVNWNFCFNLVVFSLFCRYAINSHIKNENIQSSDGQTARKNKRDSLTIFDKFYHQLFINIILAYVHHCEYMIIENLFVISSVIALEAFTNTIMRISNLVEKSRKYAIKVIWAPLLFSVLRYFQVQGFPSPWIMLGLQCLTAINKGNSTILLLQLLFTLEYIINDIDNHFSLFIICAWLLFSEDDFLDFSEKPSENEENQALQELKKQQKTSEMIIIQTSQKIKAIKLSIKIIKIQLLNCITACVIAISLLQDGIIIQKIIHVYIFVYVLFVAHGFYNDHLS